MRKRNWGALLLCLLILLAFPRASLAEEKQGFWRGVGQKLEQGVEKLGDALDNGWDAAKERFRGYKERAEQWIGESAMFLFDSVASFGGGIMDAINGVFDRSEAWLAGQFLTVTDVYLEEYAHAYALLFSEQLGYVSAKPSGEEQSALNQLISYSAQLDNQDLEGCAERIATATGMLDAWMGSAGLDYQAVRKRAERAAKAAAMRRLTSAMARTLGEYTAGAASDMTPELTRMAGELAGNGFDFESLDESWGTSLLSGVVDWLISNNISLDVFLDQVSYHLIEG